MVFDFTEGATAAGFKEFFDRIDALFDHFQVERWNHVKLALALATRHVPGFRLQKPAGAPQRCLPLKRALLVREVHRYQAGKSGSGASVSVACRHVAAVGDFGKASARTLERQYYAAIKDDLVMEAADALADLPTADHPTLLRFMIRLDEVGALGELLRQTE
jgi:hypothetical protein